MIIKKLLMMSTGVILGSMITATSFAWEPPSDDCRDARAEYSTIMDALKTCKNGTTNWRLWCEEITDIRACKNGSLEVKKAVCPQGSYGEEGVPEPYVCEALVEPEPVCENGEQWILWQHDVEDFWWQVHYFEDLGSCETEGEANLEYSFVDDYRCECGIFEGP